jgi:hypothetical protein
MAKVYRPLTGGTLRFEDAFGELRFKIRKNRINENKVSITVASTMTFTEFGILRKYSKITIYPSVVFYIIFFLF